MLTETKIQFLIELFGEDTAKEIIQQMTKTAKNLKEVSTSTTLYGFKADETDGMNSLDRTKARIRVLLGELLDESDINEAMDYIDGLRLNKAAKDLLGDPFFATSLPDFRPSRYKSLAAEDNPNDGFWG